MILTDIGLPHERHRRHARPAERLPDVPILALSAYDDDDNVFNAICAGASKYLLKNTACAAVESLKEVVDGGAPMSPGIARRCRHTVPHVPAGSSVGHLPQEMALLKSLSKGITTRPPRT